MPDSIESVIYAEAQRGLALQPVLLNELRARTGILLALITATTAFLGALVIDNDKFGCWGVAALTAFVGAVFSCLMVLSPLRKWTFSESAADMTVNYRLKKRPDDGADWTLEQMQRDLALHMEDHRDQAIKTMKVMQVWYVLAGSSLAVEIACWLIGFAK